MHIEIIISIVIFNFKVVSIVIIVATMHVIVIAVIPIVVEVYVVVTHIAHLWSNRWKISGIQGFWLSLPIESHYQLVMQYQNN